MKLNKQKIRMIVTFFVVLAVYNVLAFIMPFSHGGLFWIGYAFGMVSIITQIAIFSLAFYNAKTASSLFYGIPVARVGIIYMIIQIVVSFAAMAMSAIETIPMWPISLVSLLLFAMAVLGTVATDTARDEIVRQDAMLRENVQTMRELRYFGAKLASQTKDMTCGEEVRKLSEQLEFSDPVSSPATAEAESEINALLTEIQRAVLDSDDTSISLLCKSASDALLERNRICKLNKY